MKIISVVGARPNFMKIAPFVNAIHAHNETNLATKIDHTLVHTGQHYDDRMSKSFFKALGIPEADINLGVGSGTHAEQVGHTMIAFEKVLKDKKPDWVVVVGDVNATCACSITTKKENIQLAHIEAGLRSGDMTMPEEINRLFTDRLSDLLLTPDEISSQNLFKEGVSFDRIQFVGNIMIDTLESNMLKAKNLDICEILNRNRLSMNGQTTEVGRLQSGQYALMTLHRPSNVDHRSIIEPIVSFIRNELVEAIPLIWIIHPRTEKQLKVFGLWDSLLKTKNLHILKPLGYHELLRLNIDASMMLTDSGGLQEECCVLGTPCLTLRWNTERPITLEEYGGASVLVGNDVGRIQHAFFDVINKKRNPHRPDLWDGHTSNRIIECLLNSGL
ncbi:UDP-N-acetylglucosamine 2-epimerase [Desulfatibacillum aliphaticivorans]|uniref:UDP-N-acetylglucosamine 2-epimerase n=1 Tax=Desulfatibacillum aliphaticivorans TaxID=218208 RepID=B8F9T8_DESAL|nr:UDP-N-acetylglucosamine 2-epimerase (non-hydrolyzing) [Desulfatibacillum aliphaticivorans]ACL03034.1 UDP-N-acetylglucosamine 2-epimerase [Desulfatibacillum aliphaticivorans]